MLKFTSIELKADREVVMEAIRKDGSALQFASVEHKADRVIVLAAVRKNGTALRFVSDAFKADGEIAAAAVKQTGIALKYASVTLQDDIEIVLVALSSDMQRWGGCSYASDALRSGGLKAHVRKALSLYDTPCAVFVRLFLCSAFLNTTGGFPELNSDVQRRIAAFAGVQMEGRFAALKVAAWELGLR